MSGRVRERARSACELIGRSCATTCPPNSINAQLRRGFVRIDCMARKSHTQKLLRFGARADGRGGARENAGRPKSKKPGISHQTRGVHKARHPVHITLRLAEGLPKLRNKRTLRVIECAFRRGNSRFGFRLNHYTVQGNHLHLIVEAQDRSGLSRGLKGLAVRLARGLNSLWRRRGRVFPERYHEHVLETPREVRNVLNYVLKNFQHHSRSISKFLDEYASGLWFDGWSEPYRVGADTARERPSVPPQTWLLSKGWRRHGLIPVSAPR